MPVKNRQRLSDEIDQMKFNKEEIEKKKESVEIQGVHIKAAIEEKKKIHFRVLQNSWKNTKR